MNSAGANPQFLEAGYGGKTGYLKLQSSRLNLALGRYRAWQAIDFTRVKKLVFICKGNISRSPYSEYRARLSNVQADSFGLEGDDGKAAESSALHNAARRGVDLSGHQASHLRHYSPDQQDLLLCYEPAHAARVTQFMSDKSALDNRPQVTLLGLWCSPRRPLVFDPYGLHDEYYQTCYDVIDSAIYNLSQRLAEQVSTP